VETLAREQRATAEAQLANGDFGVDGPESGHEGRLRKLIESRPPELDLPDRFTQ
jgi:hypothetical protein